MSEEILAHIDRLIRQRPISKTALEPYRQLLALMIGERPDLEPAELKENHGAIKREEGFPLFAREDLPLDLESASRLLVACLGQLGKSERDDREGLKGALEKAETEEGWSRDLFRAILREDEKALSGMAEEVALAPEVLLFIGQTALRPSLRTLREAFTEQLEKGQWGYGYCPLCGSPPDMAFFEATGKRYLHCGLCGEEWPYPRLKCVFCQNDEQEALGYFQAENEEGLRVDFCKKCRRYIKTLDKRVLEVVAPMDIENLATLHLDVLAARQGFK